MKAENYQSDIHDSNYLKIYQNKILDASTLIAVEGKEKMTLNGNWHYQIDEYDSALRAKWPLNYDKDPTLPFDFTPDIGEIIKVPRVWNTEKKELKYYEGSLIYIKHFDIEERLLDKEHYFLHFEGAGYRTNLFLNGNYIGMHYGLSTPFSVEVTEEIKKKDNLLIAVVNAERTHQSIPEKNFDWVNYGGIYRDVFLIATGREVIKNVSVEHKEKKVVIKGTLLHGYRGKLDISSPMFKDSIEVNGRSFIYEKECSPTLWSPDNPKLYEIKIKKANTLLWRDKIGLREIKCDKNNILLNGKEIKIKGISLHEESDKRGKSVTLGEIKKAIVDAKELGCNTLRLTHYPHSREVSKLADRLGILLWEEIPVYWAIDFESNKAYEDAVNQLRELISRDISRASVIFWSVGNENADTDSRLKFMSHLAKEAKKIDPSRLVTAACLVNLVHEKVQDRLMDYLDVVSMNEYCGYYDHDMDKLRRILSNTTLDKPLVISEFGCGAKLGLHATPSTLFSEEKQEDFYSKQFAILKKFKWIAGTIIWILYDFRSPRRKNREQNGYNSKGLISSDRKRKKLSYETVKKYYED